MMCRLVQGDFYGRADLGQEMSEATPRIRDPEPAVDKKPQFEIDLRAEGVSQDAIYLTR